MRLHVREILVQTVNIYVGHLKVQRIFHQSGNQHFRAIPTAISKSGKTACY